MNVRATLLFKSDNHLRWALLSHFTDQNIKGQLVTEPVTRGWR